MKARPGVMRVTGGELAGRALVAPDGKQTRPTAARARSGLFDWLAPVLADASVLDVFAGTGSLGIEALSRGADNATFVERDRAALHCLRRNLESLGLEERARVVGHAARRALGALVERGARYDLVLVDPPYAEDWSELARYVRLAALLAPEGVLVVERRARGHNPSQAAQHVDGLHTISARTYGQTTFESYQRVEPNADGDREAGKG